MSDAAMPSSRSFAPWSASRPPPVESWRLSTTWIAPLSDSSCAAITAFWQVQDRSELMSMWTMSKPSSKMAEKKLRNSSGLMAEVLGSVPSLR